MHEMYKLFIFVAVFSAAAKLRRLALCVYKFKYKNYNMHPWKAYFTRTCPGRGCVLRRYETVSNWTTTVDTCHVIHSHTSMMILAQMLRYLLTCWMREVLLFLCTWPSQQKHAHGDRTHYSTAQRRPLVTTARLSPQHLSTAGVTFDCKN